jgi:hypothetical protein
LISLAIRIAILLVVSFAYAVFDTFNKRNVPDVFVYACLVVGLLVTFTYSQAIIEESLLIALIIGLVGYALYRKGVMGAGDYFEFATISLLLPIQPTPFLSGPGQFGFPFIFSVLITTGYAAVVCMVCYYLLKAGMSGRINLAKIERKKFYQGFGIFIAYLVLLALVSYMLGIRYVAVFLMLGIAVASALTIIFDRIINSQMVSYVYPSRLTPEDMIATNFMSRQEMEYFSKKSRHFGRLVTKKLINDIKHVKRKIPLYTSGVPLGLFALIAVVVSLLFGNILLYVII